MKTQTVVTLEHKDLIKMIQEKVDAEIKPGAGTSAKIELTAVSDGGGTTTVEAKVIYTK